MDHYSQVNMATRDYRSAASSDNKAALQQSLDAKSVSQDPSPPPQYSSYPTPISSQPKEEQQHWQEKGGDQQQELNQTHSRADSVHGISTDLDSQSQAIEEVCVRYTDAPPAIL